MNLSIRNLSKIYSNGVKALDSVNLEIKNGMFGLLGPNGAGKSTLMRTIATLQYPDHGSIFFNNINVLHENIKLRKVLGYLPQDFGVYPNVSAEKLLDYFAILKGIASKSERNTKVSEVLQLTNLYEVRKSRVSDYSGGMKQRFGIAQLLLNDPKLIIVDEPTAGLDPAERIRFLNVLRDIGTDNVVIFSTHLVDDVKDLCSKMAIINNGKILKTESPLIATSNLNGKIWKVNLTREEISNLNVKYQILSSGYNDDHSIYTRVYAEEPPSTDFESIKPNLEDVYFMTIPNIQ